MDSGSAEKLFRPILRLDITFNDGGRCSITNRNSAIFSGKRIKRGLYEAADGRRLNADINGAINIGRKELGNEWLQKLLELDGGVVDTPVVIRYLHERQSIGSLLEVGARSYETSRVSAR